MNIFNRNNFSLFLNICRNYKKKSTLKPIFLDHGEKLDEFDSRLYYEVAPPAKVDNNLSNNHPAITKFIGQMFRKGKRDIVRKVIQNTAAEIKLTQLSKYNKAQTDKERDEIELDYRAIIVKALENCAPKMYIKEIPRSGVIYSVPVSTASNADAQLRGANLLLEVVRNKDKNVRMWIVLANEFINAYNGEGSTMKRKKEIYKFCDENRAYAHIRQD